jgi:hypothetical protein
MMKSVYLPVSSLIPLSDTISDEPGVIMAVIFSTVSAGIVSRSSAAAAFDAGGRAVWARGLECAAAFLLWPCLVGAAV